jgi:hypothetical protein
MQQTMSKRGKAGEADGIIRVLLGIDCHTDTVITNYDGTRVWLKDVFDTQGRRIGVGECCLEAAPCAWHAALGHIEYLGVPCRRINWALPAI